MSDHGSIQTSTLPSLLARPWVVILVAVLLCAGFTWSWQRGAPMIPTAVVHSFLYFPVRVLIATPADAGLDYEDVRVTTADGVEIHGWYLPREDEVATLYFLHGNAGNISHRVAMLAQLHQAGFAVFILDYRGYGLSQGHPGELGTYQDALAGWRWLENRVGDETLLVLYGRSLGGALAAWLAVQESVEPDGVILESTFTGVRDMAAVSFALPGLGKLLPDMYPTLDRVREIDAPLLFIHGEVDEIVPVSHVHRLHDAAVAPKTLYTIPQAHHNDTLIVGGATYMERLLRFVQEELQNSE